MILAVDIGNTSVNCGFEVGGTLQTFVIRGAKNLTNTEISEQILKNIGKNAPKKCLIASVVPNLTPIFEEIFRNNFGADMKVLTHSDIPINIALKNRDEVGIDRLLNAFAALSEFNENCIIVDIGTATTFDVVLNQGNRGLYDGGMIFPGLELSMSALHFGTAKLPLVKFEKPSSVVGKDTVSAINSGFYYGYLGAIRNILQEISQDYGTPFKTIITGGSGALFSSTIPSVFTKDLSIIGMMKLSQR